MAMTTRSATLLAAALIAASCAEKAPPPEPPAVRPVKMLEIGGGATQVREYPGRIKAAQEAKLGFEVPGRILERPLDEGTHVEKGQVIAKLDPRDYEARLESARAELTKARKDYERWKKLFAEKVVAEIELDRKKRAVDVAEAAMRQAEKALEDTELRAPFTGVIARRLVEDYVNVQAKEPVVVLEDDSALEIRVNVPERDMVGGARRDLDELTERLKPRVVLSSLPDRSFPARFTEIATAADPVTRTYRVTLRFERPADATVLSGMTGKLIVTLPPERARGVWIPAHAVFADPQRKPHVWVVEDGKVHVREVEVGEMAGGEIHVLSGLGPGETIAVSGVHQLQEGQRVRPWKLG